MSWYIPTWLGDWCMYELLVIGRLYSHSWVIESCYSFIKYICRLYMCSGGAWTISVHLSMYKVELNQIIQHVLRGSMNNIGERISWFALCPWCQRGRVSWYYFFHQVQRGRLLALWYRCCPWWQLTQMKVHSAAGQQQRITDQTPKNEEKEVYAGSLCIRRVYMRFNRTKVAYNVYTHFQRRKSTYMLENQVFGPRYFIQSNWSEVVGPRYWPQVLGLRYWS